MRKRILLALAAVPALVSCHKNHGGRDLMTIDDFCPGSPHCTGVGDGVFYAGAGERAIVPALVETSWTDANANHLYEPGEAFVDSNGNGRFDATWLAGLGNGRAATGFNDPLSARAIAFRWNDVTVAMAYVDTIGLFADDIEEIRADPALASVDVDHIVIGSTHVHEAPDTVGLWGVDPATSGVDPAYMAELRSETALAIADAVANLQPATMTVAQALVVGTDGTTLAYNNDVRDPVIYDPTLTIARFAKQSDGTTIGTLVNWASHPEYSGRQNLISADFVGALRSTIEDGDATTSTAGLGGITVYVQGAQGGQIGPSGASPRDESGTPISAPGIAKAHAGGRAVALVALKALSTATPVTGETPLSYRTAELYARVDNTALQLLQTLGVIHRGVFFADPNQAYSATNVPYARSRVTYVQVGPMAFVTAPGELHPELWMGGYDGSWSWGQPILTITENAPDLSKAPKPPYLKDLMLDNPGVQYVFVAGLAEDFLGYIVPAYNYVLDPVSPYVDEAAGDHYEETNSVGPQCEEQLQHPMMRLAKARP